MTSERPARYSHRSNLLQEAEKIITVDRNKSYGEPDEDFQRIAAIASAMGFRMSQGDKEGDLVPRPLMGSDVARFMVALKLSRLAWNPTHRDSWLDLAGYAACGFETAQLEEDRRDSTRFAAPEKPEPEPAEWAINSEILEAGRKAAGGDPKDLEDMGYFLKETYGSDRCEETYPGHMFNGHCSMSIRRRRVDG